MKQTKKSNMDAHSSDAKREAPNSLDNMIAIVDGNALSDGMALPPLGDLGELVCQLQVVWIPLQSNKQCQELHVRARSVQVVRCVCQRGVIKSECDESLFVACKDFILERSSFLWQCWGLLERKEYPCFKETNQIAKNKRATRARNTVLLPCKKQHLMEHLHAS
jgi:hypothetical protein